MLQFLKERLSVAGSSFSGLLSLAGSYNVCHSLCLSAIAFLAVAGITVKGMPLEFLQPYSLPLWGMGVGLFAFSGYKYFAKKCVSREMLGFNAGILVAAVPFPQIAPWQAYFWIAGFGVAGIAAGMWIQKRFFRKKEVPTCCQSSSSSQE